MLLEQNSVLPLIIEYLKNANIEYIKKKGYFLYIKNPIESYDDYKMFNIDKRSFLTVIITEEINHVVEKFQAIPEIFGITEEMKAFFFDLCVNVYGTMVSFHSMYFDVKKIRYNFGEIDEVDVFFKAKENIPYMITRIPHDENNYITIERILYEQKRNIQQHLITCRYTDEYFYQDKYIKNEEFRVQMLASMLGDDEFVLNGYVTWVEIVKKLIAEEQIQIRNKDIVDYGRL